MTESSGPGFNWQEAIGVIADNPVIQTTGNHRYRWFLPDGGPLGDQLLSITNR